jgi:hypothetical protein
LVTFNLEPLKAVTKAMHDVEARLARRDNAAARARLAEARALISAMPITAEQAASEEIRASFQASTPQAKAPRQAELEQQWSSFAKEKYAAAMAKTAEAARLAP